MLLNFPKTKQESFMLKNFCKPIYNLDGQAFKDNDKDVLLKSICVNSLYAAEMDGGQQKRLSGEEHMKRHALAKKIHNCSGEIEVSAEEISLLKSLISSNYSSMLVGPVIEMLEG